MTKRAIITISEFASIPGKYTVRSDKARDRRGVIFERNVDGASAAAAVALELGMLAGASGYQIFGPAAGDRSHAASLGRLGTEYASDASGAVAALPAAH